MKRALVTGGNRGIGLAVARDLVRDHEVLIGVRDLAAGQAIAAQIGARAVHIDLTRPETLDAASALNIDVLINNAGILRDVSLLSPDSDFDAAMQVMVRGPLQLIRAVTPHMAAQGWGRIVNVTSDWGAFSDGLKGPGAYGVAKAALNALTHALPRDLPVGVTVNSMAPGWVATDMGGPDAPLSAAQGADTITWLARHSDSTLTGRFFKDRQEIPW